MAKRHALNRDEFLQRIKNRKRLEVPMGDGVVYVEELSGQGILDYNDKIEELKRANPELTASNSMELVTLLVTKTVCDADGNLLLKAEDVEALRESSLATLKMLAEKALVVSGISPDVAQEAASTLQDPFDASTTDLPKS